LVPTRRGKTFINVPTPVRRNQRDIIALQAFYNAVQSRKEKAFKDKLRCEIFALTTEKKQSSTLRLRSRYIANIYEERA
jgi:ribosomal protein S7